MPMGLLRTSIMGAVVVAALAGCTEAPLASSPSTVDTSSPIPSSGPTGSLRATAPAKRLSADETRGLESTPWRVVSEGGDQLEIEYIAGGGCSEWKGIRVHETSKRVEIWTAVKTSHASQACPSDLLLGESTIRLAQPLGTRRLLHAPLSKRWKTSVKDF